MQSEKFTVPVVREPRQLAQTFAFHDVFLAGLARPSSTTTAAVTSTAAATTAAATLAAAGDRGSDDRYSTFEAAAAPPSSPAPCRELEME
jgi:hypothetical protein